MESNSFLTPPYPPPLSLKIPWSPSGMMPSRCVKCFRWKLLSYEDFFLHAVDGVQVEPMVSRETRPQHQVKGLFHCVAWKYGMNFILGIGSLFCILLEQYFPVYPIPIWYTCGWREAQHNDLSKSWTQTCQTGGHLANHWTTGSLMKRGGGSWIHYDLKLS